MGRSRRFALLAAAGFLFYPAFVYYDFVLLTEVLFTILLTAFGRALVALGEALERKGELDVARAQAELIEASARLHMLSKMKRRGG